MPKAHVSWTGDMKFNGIDRNGHIVLMEASPKYGGNGDGVAPLELLLSALGGCAGIDIVTMLKARKQNLISFDVEIEGVRKETLPKIFESVDVKFYLKGDLDEKVVTRVVDLVMTKICPIAAMLCASTNLKWNCEITQLLIEKVHVERQSKATAHK